jgi:ribosomal protein S18 acetylase RimI-like enzyme
VVAEPTGGGTGEDIGTENGVMSLLVPKCVKDEIMGMTLDEFGKERYRASNLAGDSARPGCGRGWQSAPRTTADRRATLFPERSGRRDRSRGTTVDPEQGRRIPGTQRHRRHDELVSEVGLWYTRSIPEMGFCVEERRFGFYQRQKDTGRFRATVRRLPAEDVPKFIEDLREYAGEEKVRFYVDDRGLDERIGPVLLERGCAPDVAEVFLAHTGEMPLLASEPEHLSVEAVSEDTIEVAIKTERKAFSSSEAEPDAKDLRRRLALRRAEMGGQGRFLLARVAGEPASIVAFYEGEDRFVHHLATRVPFRRRGIASRLLMEVLAGARERGCRSTIISAAESGHPVGLYRSLGFTDEVYWRRKYKHFPGTGRRAI